MLLFHLVVDVRCNKPVAFSKREFGVHETDSIDGGYNQSFASVLVDGRDNKAFQSKTECLFHWIHIEFADIRRIEFEICASMNPKLTFGEGYGLVATDINYEMK